MAAYLLFDNVEVTDQAALDQIDGLSEPAYVLYGPLPSGLRVISLKPEWRGATFSSDHGTAWNQLDVSILHSVVGGKVLGLSEEDMSSQRYFTYTRDANEAVIKARRPALEM